MPLAIGIKFRRNGPLNYYDPAGEEFRSGERVVADTARGPEIGEVVMPAADLAPNLLPAELKPVIRRATGADLERRRELEAQAPEQIRLAKERVHASGLEAMKIIAASTSFDGGRILFDFSADGRVDFRDLARDLATTFQCRVELRQIYPRDEAKIQDGYGPCGRRLCCSSWLKEFQPVSIKHAKEQGLPLNPSKLNGMCGKLKCCLVYENEQYVDTKRSLPAPGEPVDLPDGPGVVREIDVPREQVMVAMLAGGIVAVPADQLRLAQPRPATSEPGGGGRGKKRRRS